MYHQLTELDVFLFKKKHYFVLFYIPVRKRFQSLINDTQYHPINKIHSQ